jgi:hypothetical protein
MKNEHFEPRILDNPNKPETSNWYHIIADDQILTFDTREKAVEEGLAYCDEHDIDPEHLFIAHIKAELYKYDLIKTNF